MARVGIYALNMSPRTGGVWSLIQGLMRHAAHSQHEFVLVTEKSTSPRDLPPNVECIQRPAPARFATQAMMNLPVARPLLARRTTATIALAAAGCFSPNLFDRADLWLWPHCFRPVPDLGTTVTICHDLIHRHCPEFFSRSELARRRHGERSLEHCAGVLCPSASTAADFRTAYPELPSPTCFTPGPVEVVAERECEREMSELNGRFGDRPLFLFVGVDWPHKNHTFLVDVATRLARQGHTDFHVLFAGRRRTGIPPRMIVKRGASRFVTDLGPVSRPMLGALYRRATALLFPSLYEGFGIPLVEAMQYRLPIVASDRSCIPEVCGDAAVLLPLTSSQCWADAIRLLIESPSRREDLSRRSALRGEEFSWERTWDQLDQTFDAVLQGRRVQQFRAKPAGPARPLVAAH